jgi:hypothetical protein
MMKLCSFLLSVLLALPLRAQTPEVPLPRMNVVVVSGEGAINNVRLRQGNDVVVQVRDGNRRPLSGAKVVFRLPETGPTAHFPDRSRVHEMATDGGGRAAVRVTPDDVTGTVPIEITAEHGTETASATVTQFNMYVPQAKSGGRGKWAALVVVIGAAAAGGAVAALQTDNRPAVAAPPAAIGITTGPGTVGPPR